MVAEQAAPTVVGLFAGIGGIEVGFKRAGFQAVLLCELDPAARAVLATRFAEVPLAEDIRKLRTLPEADVVAAGFPCQDLSQAGGKAGIRGRNSGLVENVFRLLEKRRRRPPRWLVLENVAYMLSLDRGKAIAWLTSRLGTLGYRWAYRVIDARSFGVPHRRQRVFLVASRVDDPRDVLFADESDPEARAQNSLGLVSREAKEALSRVIEPDRAYGFYWTEGTRGLGWTVDAVPPIKGGSGLGIPSPPAVWLPMHDFLGTPTLGDAERLQGFPDGWTEPAEADAAGRRRRWNLIGNAVCTEMAAWLGDRLGAPGRALCEWEPLPRSARWPSAAWGEGLRAYSVHASLWPVCRTRAPLIEFLEYELQPLSPKATAGFYKRATTGRLRFAEGFITSVKAHLARVEQEASGEAKEIQLSLIDEVAVKRIAA